MNREFALHPHVTYNTRTYKCHSVVLNTPVAC